MYIKTTFADFLNENKNIDISGIIKFLIKEYKDNGYTNCNLINSGSCDNFAEDLMEIIEESGGECEILSDGLFYYTDSETPAFNILDYGTPPEIFYKIEKLPSHYWVYYNKKHYDCESPNGVSDVFQLPIFKRFYKRI